MGISNTGNVWSMDSGITVTNSLKNSRGRREVAQSNQQPECTRSENEQK